MTRQCVVSTLVVLVVAVCQQGSAHYPPCALPNVDVTCDQRNVQPPVPNYYFGTCKQILAFNPSAPSGVYNIIAPNHKLIEVYCEMGLNGGGYTFFNPAALAYLTDGYLQTMFTDKTSFLMRIRKCDSSQPYIVLSQLPQYMSTPLSVSLSNYVGYTVPVNEALLGAPYIHFGFLPAAQANNHNVQGVTANEIDQAFINGDENPNSHIILFPNYAEKQPTNYSFSVNWPFCDTMFASARINPSHRDMPVEYFMFTELHFGGGGCYSQTDDRTPMQCIQATTIGFR